MLINPRTKIPEDCVVLDTETTGFDPEDNHRMLEIGAIRMRKGLPTKEKFHVLINPQRSVPQAAVDVHGHTEASLRNEPTFEQVADRFLQFLGDDHFVAHNAEFDFKFFNAELNRAGKPILDRSRMHDSIAIARQLYPGSPAGLDSLCRKFNISLKGREKHGALIDSELLAEVIVEMGGGRQQTMFGSLSSQDEAQEKVKMVLDRVSAKTVSLSAEQEEAHRAFVEKELGKDSLWAQFYSMAQSEKEQCA